MENNDEGPSVATFGFVFLLVIVCGVFLIGNWIYSLFNPSFGGRSSNEIYESGGHYYSAPAGGTASVGGVYYYKNGSYYVYDSSSGEKKATGWVPEHVRNQYEGVYG